MITPASAEFESDLSRSFAIAQTAFDNELKITQGAKRSAEQGFHLSRRSALILKIIAFFGGLAVLIGVGETATRFFGILVAVAVGVDGIFLNHGKLMAYEQATAAYEGLLDRIKNSFQNEHVPLVKFQTTKPGEFAEGMIAMLTRLRNELFTERQKISKALKEFDREALKAYSLQSQIPGIPNVPAIPGPPQSPTDSK
jgi:hypothetical protein